jgi:hypothetical protein
MKAKKGIRHKPPVPLKLFLPPPEKPFNIRYFSAKKKQLNTGSSGIQQLAPKRLLRSALHK